MMPMADDRWAAVGVVSWGIRCGEPTKPGVYTRTSITRLSILMVYQVLKYGFSLNTFYRSLHRLDPLGRPTYLGKEYVPIKS